MSNAQQLTVADIAVRQDSEGRFNLNDLHKAAGGERRYDTREFLDRDHTKELVSELESQLTEIPVNKKPGRYGGTFVVEDLVYTYAMWISPAFHLKVVRAYRQANANPQPAQPQVPQTMAQALRFAAEQAEQIEQLESDNKEMSDELNFVTINEYIALDHRYMDRGTKSLLGRAASKMAKQKGIELDHQERTVSVRGGKEKLTSVKVYPRHLLEEAEALVA